jgi:hypothetical protein
MPLREPQRLPRATARPVQAHHSNLDFVGRVAFRRGTKPSSRIADHTPMIPAGRRAQCAAPSAAGRASSVMFRPDQALVAVLDVYQDHIEARAQHLQDLN